MGRYSTVTNENMTREVFDGMREVASSFWETIGTVDAHSFNDDPDVEDRYIALLDNTNGEVVGFFNGIAYLNSQTVNFNALAIRGQHRSFEASVTLASAVADWLEEVGRKYEDMRFFEVAAMSDESKRLCKKIFRAVEDDKDLFEGGPEVIGKIVSRVRHMEEIFGKMLERKKLRTFKVNDEKVKGEEL